MLSRLFGKENARRRSLLMNAYYTAFRIKDRTLINLFIYGTKVNPQYMGHMVI
ncbi:hypothetical protein [Vibrio gallaecicus]|uniref:Uncharacterized protein n=1 Tax=Vibrio gallaecicus TaxID=552386 RepID=A0ABV4N6E4_9VIBR